MKKRLLLTPLLLLALFVGVLLARTATFSSRQLEVEPFTPVAVDARAAAERLAQAIRIQTISHQDSEQVETAAFEQLHALLETSFPRVHATLARERISELALLYTWNGSDPSLPPTIFLAHQDVVAVAPDTESDWTHPAFAGVVADGYIWGRGTLDDKGALLGILEAAEALIAEGFTPRRTLHFAFGHDEEVGGQAGAKETARLLEERGVRAYFCLDEGLAITHGIVPGVRAPVALIGTAEKGYLSVALTAEVTGGHSSAPPPDTAIGMVSRAVAALEANPFPGRLAGPARDMLECVGPEMDFPMRLVMANLWAFGPIVRGQLESAPATAAALRSTIAPTIFEAGVKENVLPATARAVVNLRIMPGETIEGALAHVRNTIADDRVSVAVIPPANEPSPVASVDAPAYETLNRSIRQVFPEAVVAPMLVLGGTDSRHYTAVAENVYKFLPFPLGEDDLPRFHGTDERVAVEDYVKAIQFYALLMRNAAG
ncbi:MAG TPA: M20 family peptidase [Candidatus Hydrogenedentes bacterium]|nr:M20 family peptidase [Candidatus Hydrogenedentota bacterium]